MDKIISRDCLKRNQSHLQNLESSIEDSKIEEFIEIIKCSDETSINKEKVQELKAKVESGQYIVDYDAVGDEIFKDFVLEL